MTVSNSDFLTRCHVGFISAAATTLTEIILSIYMHVKSEDQSHPFHAMQKLNILFFVCSGLLTIISILNLIPLVSFINQCRIASEIVKLTFSRIVVTLFMSFFHSIASACLLTMYVIVIVKSSSYFSISEYKSSENIKQFVDASQKTFSCCGKITGSSDWDGRVPSSCCNGQICASNVNKRPCLPLLRYVLGIPLIVGFAVIVLSICVNILTLFTSGASSQSTEIEKIAGCLREDNAEEKKPPVVQPKPLNRPGISPHFMTQTDILEEKWSDFRKSGWECKTDPYGLKARGQQMTSRYSPRSSSNTDYGHTLEDELELRVLADFGVKKAVSALQPKNKQQSVRTRQSNSMPTRFEKIPIEADLASVNNLLNMNLDDVLGKSSDSSRNECIHKVEDDISEIHLETTDVSPQTNKKSSSPSLKEMEMPVSSPPETTKKGSSLSNVKNKLKKFKKIAKSRENIVEMKKQQPQQNFKK